MDQAPSKVISGLSEFQAAVREAVAEAAVAGWRELWMCDVDFAHWPLGEVGVVENLTQWAQGQRRLTLLALDFAEVQRRHARWVQWRRHWSHGVTCRELHELQADDVPVILLVPGALTLRLLDPLHYRGLVSRDPSEGIHARELIDAISQRSSDAFPVTTLGL